MDRKENLLSRRNLLKLAIGTTVGSVTAHEFLISKEQNSPPSPDLKRLEEDGRRYTPEIVSAAKQFMRLDVPQRGDRNRRTDKEVELFKHLETKKASTADVIHALSAAGSITARSWGMELIWRKRQEGELARYGVEPLDDKRIEWALDNEIDPRVLAISREALIPASEMLQAAPELFFEAIPNNERLNLKVENTLPNPGVMAKLNMTETGFTNPYNANRVNRHWGYVYIGGASAVNEINTSPDLFPKDKDHLKVVAAKLQAQTKLPYLVNINHIPGSQKGSALSGGAIGPQFMPSNARLFMEMYDIANRKLGNKYPYPNPFDPFTGTVMCYLYLASEWFARHGDLDNKSSVIRPGYRASNSDEQKIIALNKWNPTEQARIALEAGYSYFKEFGRV